LPAAALAAAVLLPRPEYEAIRPIVRESTSAFLELGLFGAAALPVGPDAARILRLRRALARANRLRLELVDATGLVAPASFVNLLESPADSIPFVLACFSYAPSFVGAVPSRPKRRRPNEGLS
jgi:hypothetical protein